MVGITLHPPLTDIPGMTFALAIGIWSFPEIIRDGVRE
jgi:hypothetical protein